MKNTILISLTLLSAIIFGGCCGDCNGIYLGSFLIKEDSKSWIDYADNQARRFQGPVTQSAIFTYTFPAFSLNPDVFNCEIDDCGTCCDEYDTEVAAFAFTSDDINVNFTISLQPDFINRSPANQPEEIDDYLTIGMSGDIFGDLFIADPALEDRVTVNGIDFRNVFARELDRAGLDTTSRQPWAYYFTEAQGIVGFKLANGEEWALVE